MKNVTFVVYKAFFSIQNIKKFFFLAFFAPKKDRSKRSIFGQKSWTNPFAKCRLLSSFLEVYFWGLKSIFFLSRISKIVSFWFCLLKKKNYEKKVDFFDKSHGQTRLQNVDFLDFFRTSLVLSKKHCFLFRISKNVFSWVSLLKRKNMKKRSIFWKKRGLNPFEKSRFFGLFWNLTFKI